MEKMTLLKNSQTGVGAMDTTNNEQDMRSVLMFTGENTFNQKIYFTAFYNEETGQDLMGITIEQKGSDGNVTNVQPYTTVFSDMEPIIKNLRKLATKYKKEITAREAGENA